MRIADVDRHVTVIIPCLNEEAPIADAVREVLSEQVDEVIVVDNGSTDATAWRARQAGARVVTEPRRGYGRACAAGFAAIGPRADIVCFLDGDGSDVPRFIPDVVRPIVENRADFVMGSRLRGTARNRQHDAAAIGRRAHVPGFASAFLQCPVHRHVAIPRDAGGKARGSRHDRNDLWLESRNADARRRLGPAHRGNPRRSSLPARRRIESVGKVAGRAQRRLEDFGDIRPAALFAEKSRIGGDKTRYAAATSRRK